MKKMIYFDMDGTIADLYGVDDWLPMLRAENPLPYTKCQPMVDMVELTYLCQKLQQKGYGIGIITWLAKDSSKEYKLKTKKAKKDWLKRHFPVQFDETHFVQYGTPKHIVARDKKGLLFDDSDEVIAAWIGYQNEKKTVFDVKQVNILHLLRAILEGKPY